jgi:hypothetical protein
VIPIEVTSKKSLGVLGDPRVHDRRPALKVSERGRSGCAPVIVLVLLEGELPDGADDVHVLALLQRARKLPLRDDEKTDLRRVTPSEQDTGGCQHRLDVALHGNMLAEHAVRLVEDEVDTVVGRLVGPAWLCQLRNRDPDSERGRREDDERDCDRAASNHGCDPFPVDFA